MGFPYTLIKKESPDAFNLGKGAWDQVFDRKYGTYIPLIGFTGSNFEETFRIDSNTLEEKIRTHRPIFSDHSQEVATKIITWAGISDLYLINYWEELEYFQEKKWRKKADEEFTDLRDKLIKPLYDYKITGSIYED